MKFLATAFLALLLPLLLNAQKIDYKNNVISVDGKDIAKVNKIKMNFGLTNNFELYSLSGKKLIIATLASDFVPPRNDNSFFYYRFTFLTANQVGIFGLSKLGSEKSFVNLIASANIMADDDLNAQAVTELIATKSLNPRVVAEYHLVSRDINFPFTIKMDKTIEQQRKTVGSFKNVTIPGSGVASYEFSLPEGLIIAKVSFTGGNNAQNFEVYTAKDNFKRLLPLPTNEKIIISSETPEDVNYFALKRFIQWLIDHKYM